jgi:hypothetical protein
MLPDDLTNQQPNQDVGLNGLLAGFGQQPAFAIPPDMFKYYLGRLGSGNTLPPDLYKDYQGRLGSGNTIGQNTIGQNTTGSGFGFNMPTLALGLQGLNSLGSLYMGTKSLGLANKQFESAQKFATANLANQTHAYNDTLAQRIRRVGSGVGTSKEEMDAEYARRKLPASA